MQEHCVEEEDTTNSYFLPPSLLLPPSFLPPSLLLPPPYLLPTSSLSPPCLQIFFHYSELNKDVESDIEIGSSVDFVMQNRQVSMFAEVLPHTLLQVAIAS